MRNTSVTLLVVFALVLLTSATDTQTRVAGLALLSLGVALMFD